MKLLPWCRFGITFSSPGRSWNRQLCRSHHRRFLLAFCCLPQHSLAVSAVCAALRLGTSFCPLLRRNKIGRPHFEVCLENNWIQLTEDISIHIFWLGWSILYDYTVENSGHPELRQDSILRLGKSWLLQNSAIIQLKHMVFFAHDIWKLWATQELKHRIWRCLADAVNCSVFVLFMFVFSCSLV